MEIFLLGYSCYRPSAWWHGGSLTWLATDGETQPKPEHPPGQSEYAERDCGCATNSLAVGPHIRSLLRLRQGLLNPSVSLAMRRAAIANVGFVGASGDWLIAGDADDWFIHANGEDLLCRRMRDVRTARNFVALCRLTPTFPNSTPGGLRLRASEGRQRIFAGSIHCLTALPSVRSSPRVPFSFVWRRSMPLRASFPYPSVSFLSLTSTAYSLPPGSFILEFLPRRPSRGAVITAKFGISAEWSRSSCRFCEICSVGDFVSD